ncbi:MAG: hypothetical protein AB7E47_06990 [Desulfovibrionaceae bacterium]
MRRLTAIDARILIATAAAFGVFAWHAGPVGLALYSAGLAWAWRRTDAPPAGSAQLRGYALFVLFWMAVTFALATLFPEGSARPDIWAEARRTGLLGWRLALMIGIGLCLARSGSPHRLGLALCWALRPLVGRDRAWRAALSLSLMIHFLPLATDSAARARHALTVRNLRLPLLQRLTLLPQTVFRCIAQKTWTQTIAVAARNLDRPEAWTPHFAPQPAAWAMGVALIATGWAATLL